MFDKHTNESRGDVMENTINRKEYRREYRKDEEYQHRANQEETHIKNGALLSKIINAMLLLLSILLLKFFCFEEELFRLKDSLSRGISFEEIQAFVLEQYDKAIGDRKFYEAESQVEPSKNAIEEMPELKNESMIGENSTEELENIAIQGVNQLLDDSEYIKQNFEIKWPVNGIITSIFGNRVSDNPIVSSYHTGLDIAVNQGTDIKSAHEGVVTQAGANGSYGNSVMITSGDLVTLYGHCLSIQVKEGDTVESGQNIAKVGMTGNATGPHVHFEVRLGDRFVNPQDVLPIQ